MSNQPTPQPLDLLHRLRQVVWDLECSCPDRPEVHRAYDLLDELQDALENQEPGADPWR